VKFPNSSISVQRQRPSNLFSTKTNHSISKMEESRSLSNYGLLMANGSRSGRTKTASWPTKEGWSWRSILLWRLTKAKLSWSRKELARTTNNGTFNMLMGPRMHPSPGLRPQAPLHPNLNLLVQPPRRSMSKKLVTWQQRLSQSQLTTTLGNLEIRTRKLSWRNTMASNLMNTSSFSLNYPVGDSLILKRTMSSSNPRPIVTLRSGSLITRHELSDLMPKKTHHGISSSI